MDNEHIYSPSRDRYQRDPAYWAHRDNVEATLQEERELRIEQHD